MLPDMKGVIYLNSDENQDNNGNISQTPLPHEEIEQKTSNDVLTLPIKKYIDDYRKYLIISGVKAENPIVVDEIASKIASFYEKARRIIDWKEENPKQKYNTVQNIIELCQAYPVPMVCEFLARVYRRNQSPEIFLKHYAKLANPEDPLLPPGLEMEKMNVKINKS